MWEHNSSDQSYPKKFLYSTVLYENSAISEHANYVSIKNHRHTSEHTTDVAASATSISS